MTLQKKLEITNKRGLHARASAKFVKCVEIFDADVLVSLEGQTVPGTSILGLMMLAAAMNTTIEVSATSNCVMRPSTLAITSTGGSAVVSVNFSLDTTSG